MLFFIRISINHNFPIASIVIVIVSAIFYSLYNLNYFKILSNNFWILSYYYSYRLYPNVNYTTDHLDPSIAGMIVDSAFTDLSTLAEEIVEKGRKQGLFAPGAHSMLCTKSYLLKYIYLFRYSLFRIISVPFDHFLFFIL